MSITTLIVSAVLMIAACYTYFDNRTKSEIKSEAEIASVFLNADISAIDKIKITISDTRQITLISPKGDIIFDSSGTDKLDINKCPEISEALKYGEGISERVSESAGKDMYHYALKLENGSILRISEYKDNMPSVFYTMLISVLFIMALMYIVTAVASTMLTENIVKPIRKINLSSDLEFDDIYEEIRPFLKRIARQNEEIDRQTGKVTEQKARLRAIMDNINEGLIILDRHSIILSINKPALNIFGKEEDEIKHKSSKILTDREQIHSVVKKALSGEKSNVMFESKSRTYQIFYSPIYDDEDINGAVMLLFDVTERTESEKIRREFTANVSHELKTPLTTIHGYAQIITGGIAKSEDIDGFIKKIEKESSRLMVLVDDNIELSHLDESTTDAPKQHISLKALASEVMDSLQSKAHEKEVTLELKGTESEIYANLSQISEMVYNLVDNAIKYNKDGGRVTVTIKDKTIIVSDTGIGIPEKYFDRIFERFFRVDKSHSKKVNGTGLGLSIVKHIAKINGAELKVESTPGEGSTFTVSF